VSVWFLCGDLVGQLVQLGNDRVQLGRLSEGANVADVALVLYKRAADVEDLVVVSLCLHNKKR